MDLREITGGCGYKIPHIYDLNIMIYVISSVYALYERNSNAR